MFEASSNFKRSAGATAVSLFFIASTALTVSAEPATTETAEPTVAIDLAFITHLDANLPEQDVYIERVAGSGEVFRVTNGDNNMAVPLFKVAVETKHDPFDPKAVGPHAKGEALGMTLGEWLRHKGAGSYTCTDGVGSLNASFTNLVPNGVYTMWSWYVAIPFPEPFATYDLPFGTRDGAASAFSADTSGNATYNGTIGTCLQGSGSQIAEGLAIAYHSDGNTYGPHMGPAGEVAHVHLFLLLPPSADMPS